MIIMVSFFLLPLFYNTENNLHFVSVKSLRSRVLLCWFALWPWFLRSRLLVLPFFPAFRVPLPLLCGLRFANERRGAWALAVGLARGTPLVGYRWSPSFACAADPLLLAVCWGSRSLRPHPSPVGVVGSAALSREKSD